MFVSKTPYRISLFGGGSDYPAWYNEKEGCVIGGAINKYCYLSVRKLPPFFEHDFRIVYSKIELVNEIKNIQHPSVRELLNYFKIQEGLEIQHIGDLPAQSGIGSSSAFTVGLLNALSALHGNKLSPLELSYDSIYIEQELIQEFVGSQDQVMVAHGGFNFIEFSKKNISVHPVKRTQCFKKLENNLLLFFTGKSRNSNINAEKIINNLPKNEKNVLSLMELAKKARSIIENDGVADDIGHMLKEAWERKKQYASTISSSIIDDYFSIAEKNGALGGKILGAGGGGFLLFYVPEENQKNVISALEQLTHVEFCFSNHPSQVVESSDF